MTPPRVVVFDLDDTLYPKRAYVRSGLAAVAAMLEEPTFATVAWDLFASGARGRIFDQALARLGIAADAALIRRLVDCYRMHPPAIALFPEVPDVLTGLAAQCRLALLSDGPLAAQRQKVDALGIRAWLRPIVLTDRLGRAFWKPHVRGFQAIERLTACAGPACVYVGDNPHKDFTAPRTLGWRTVRVRRRDTEHASAPSDGVADAECSDLEEAARLLGFPTRAGRSPADVRRERTTPCGYS